MYCFFVLISIPNASMPICEMPWYCCGINFEGGRQADIDSKWKLIAHQFDGLNFMVQKILNGKVIYFPVTFFTFNTTHWILIDVSRSKCFNFDFTIGENCKTLAQRTQSKCHLWSIDFSFDVLDVLMAFQHFSCFVVFRCDKQTCRKRKTKRSEVNLALWWWWRCCRR